MSKKVKVYIFNTIVFVCMLLALTMLTSSCGNKMAKEFGGTVKVELVNKKLINITWKEESLWVLTKELKPTDSLDVYEFNEDSEYGIMNGRVIITEIRK